MLDKIVDTNEEWTLQLSSAGKNNEKIGNTVENFVLILENDSKLKDLYMFNDFNNHYEYHAKDKKPRIWTDTDDAKVSAYIEKSYELYNEKKYAMALRLSLIHI